MVRFDPKIHVPVNDWNRIAIESALLEGWELMVDEATGKVWIGNEEMVGAVTLPIVARLNQLSVDCIAQHLKVFHEQTASGREADFGEPCSTCPHVMRECKLEWLSRMDPLFQMTDRQICLDLRMPPCEEGNCGSCACAKGIENQNRMVRCREDGKLHNSEEMNACYCEDKDTCIVMKGENV